MIAVLSDRFRLELLKRRAAGVKMYELAQQLGMHPSVFSAIVNEIVPLKANDARVVRIGALLGLQPAQCFTRRKRLRKAVA